MSNSSQAKLLKWCELPSDQPMPLLERRRVVGEKAMISNVTLRRGCFVPSHSHVNEQFACVLQGRLKFGLGTPGADDYRELIAGGGDVMHLPSLVMHSAEALEDTVVLDIFAPPSTTTGIDRRS